MVMAEQMPLFGSVMARGMWPYLLAVRSAIPVIGLLGKE